MKIKICLPLWEFNIGVSILVPPVFNGRTFIYLRYIIHSQIKLVFSKVVFFLFFSIKALRSISKRWFFYWHSESGIHIHHIHLITTYLTSVFCSKCQNSFSYLKTWKGKSTKIKIKKRKQANKQAKTMYRWGVILSIQHNHWSVKKRKSGLRGVTYMTQLYD